MPALTAEPRIRFTVLVQQQEVDESLRALFEVLAETFDVLRLQLDVRFQNDIRGAILVIEETPAGRLQQPIDFDPGRCFLA